MTSSARDLVVGQRPESQSGKGGTIEQYLTFTLADEHYGVDILRVQEIKGWTPVTRIPSAPDYLRGVLNLRGTIVPIVDLRLRFGLTDVEYAPTTVVIVLCVHTANGETRLGIVVDGVSDVLNIAREEVKPAPDFGTLVQTEYIHGLADTDEGMVMLLDIDRLLSLRELQAIDTLARQESD